MQQIYSFHELAEKMRTEKEMVLLKHSNTCPRSAKAYEEMLFFEQNAKVPVYYVVVQESRDVSNEIADRFHIVHQSPQAFYIKDEEIKWEAHHWDVTEEALNGVREKY